MMELKTVLPKNFNYETDTLTEEQAGAIAIEFNEVIPLITVIARLNNRSRVLVIYKFLDGLVGTDPTAIFKSAPMIPSSVMEHVSDPVLRYLAEAINKKWFPEPTITPTS
jgi:hypothetical protein